jgi:hypothetical protein
MAYPLDQHFKTNSNDLIHVLIDFFTYNNVSNTHDFTLQGGDLLDGS